MTDTLKVAIVTGASRGIGAATALALAKSGHRLVLTAIEDNLLQAVRQQVLAAGSEAVAIAGDLCDLNFARSIVETAVNTFGRVDVLVNNAAAREIESMRNISPEAWERTLRICLTVPAFLSRWAAGEMERHSHGVIVNVSSIMSQQASGIAPAYIASKGGLDALTYELASLYGPSGIRVVGVRPGAIDTAMSQTNESAPSSDDEIRAYSEDMIMLQRWGTAEEVAEVIAFLASDAARYVTGTNVAIDGGWLRQHLPLSVKRRRFTGDFP